MIRDIQKECPFVLRPRALKSVSLGAKAKKKQEEIAPKSSEKQQFGRKKQRRNKKKLRPRALKSDSLGAKAKKKQEEIAPKSSEKHQLGRKIRGEIYQLRAEISGQLVFSVSCKAKPYPRKTRLFGR